MFFLLVASRRYVFAISSYQVLDYEANSSYSLTVRVSDGLAIVSQPLTISIRDVNDPPVFTDAPYAVNVNESEVAGAVSVSGYTLTVRASDSYGGVAVTSLYVNVVNQNDGPAFVGTPYSASVNENIAIGSTVISLTATDQDGDFLTFNLTGSNDFTIGTSNGIITTNQV